MRLAIDIAFATAVSAAVLYAGWHWYGPFGLVFGAPILAIFGRPLVEILGSMPRRVRYLALRRHGGRYYEFRGRAMDIHVDADGRCWVATADVRKITALPAEPVLLRLVPGQVRELGDPVAWRLSTEGAAQVLGKSTDAQVAKFLTWLEREVALPARNRRERRM
ncbi:MAG TPA: hypothetical protein VIN75_23990 [Burkholderiaceae bacterium]